MTWCYILLGYIYLIWTFSWSLFAAYKQQKLYDKRVFLCWVLNFIFAPIAIIIATIRKADISSDVRARIIISPIVMPIAVISKLLAIMFGHLSDWCLNLEEKLNKFDEIFGEFIIKVVKFITTH